MSDLPDEQEGRAAKDVAFLGMPGWFYLVVLDVLALLGITIWIVTKNEGNVSAYDFATAWALRILALSYLAVMLFVFVRGALNDRPVRVAAWSLPVVIALALLRVHWVGVVAVTLIVVAQLFFESRAKA